MCGRYTLRSRGQAKFYGIPAAELPLPELVIPRYNIAPSQNVPAIVEGPNGCELTVFQWGLVPSWSKDASGFINARRNARAKTKFCGIVSETQVLDPGRWFLRMGAPRKIEAALFLSDEG